MRRLLFTILLIVLPSTHPAFSESAVRITNGEWAPYLSENLPEKGFASHVVKMAFKAAGLDVEYGFFPWKRSYKLARDGDWDGSVVWVRTADREKDFYFSDTVVTDREFLFHLKSLKLEWTTVQDLKGLTIGGTLHTVYPLFDAAETKGLIKIERAGTYQNLYRRLLKTRIQAIPQVSQVGHYLMRTTLTADEQSQITYSPTVIQTREYALILSRAIPENENMIDLFNNGLALIRQNGVYSKLLRRLSSGGYDPGGRP